MNNVAIIVGHDYFREGAYSSILEMSEYTYNLRAAKASGFDFYLHKPNTSYKRKMFATYKDLHHYDLTIELHFNAAIPQANGVECMYFHTNKVGYVYAEKFCTFMSNRYDLRNRGAKPLSNNNQRGYWAVASGRPTGLLVEPFFGTNAEANKFKCPEEYGKVLAEFVLSL